MDRKTIRKADSRFRLARRSINNLMRAEKFEDFEDSWYQFICAAKSVHTVLELGSKGNPKSRQWMDGKNTFRNNDPLLQYIYQSRNDNEHGLDTGLDASPGPLAIGAAGPGYSRAMNISGTVGPGGGLRVTSLDGKPVRIEQKAGQILLKEVRGGIEKRSILRRLPISAVLFPTLPR